MLAPPGIDPSGTLAATARERKVFRDNTVMIGQDPGVTVLFAIMSIAIVCCIDLFRCNEFVAPGNAVTESDYLAEQLQG